MNFAFSSNYFSAPYSRSPAISYGEPQEITSIWDSYHDDVFRGIDDGVIWAFAENNWVESMSHREVREGLLEMQADKDEQNELAAEAERELVEA